MQKVILGMDRQGDDVEVTPQQMDAGAAILWESGIVDVQLESDRELVAEIFRAMVHIEAPLQNSVHIACSMPAKLWIALARAT